MTNKLSLTVDGERQVVVTRRFQASQEAVYRAHTDPVLIQKWLLGPEGWTMPLCLCEARPGGKIRYEWRSFRSIPTTLMCPGPLAF